MLWDWQNIQFQVNIYKGISSVSIQEPRWQGQILNSSLIPIPCYTSQIVVFPLLFHIFSKETIIGMFWFTKRNRSNLFDTSFPARIINERESEHNNCELSIAFANHETGMIENWLALNPNWAIHLSRRKSIGNDHGWAASMVGFNRWKPLGLPISPHLRR